METYDCLGLRYSSSKPPNFSWMAWGAERAGALTVDGVEYVGATVAERLARTTFRVAGVDVPLGVPGKLARAMVPLATTGSQVLDHIVTTSAPVLDASWATFATEHPGTLRYTECLTHGAPAITSPKPPSWRALRGMAQCIWPLRERIRIMPFDTLELVPSASTMMEVLPAATLRLLGLPYLRLYSDETYSANALTEERMRCLSSLPDALSSLGTRLELPAHLAYIIAEDTHGNALQALLSLITVYLATRGHWTPPPLAGTWASRALLEGWIVRPG
jgi:hypothetical protein